MRNLYRDRDGHTLIAVFKRTSGGEVHHRTSKRLVGAYVFTRGQPASIAGLILDCEYTVTAEQSHLLFKKQAQAISTGGNPMRDVLNGQIVRKRKQGLSNISDFKAPTWLTAGHEALRQVLAYPSPNDIAPEQGTGPPTTLQPGCEALGSTRRVAPNRDAQLPADYPSAHANCPL